YGWNPAEFIKIMQFLYWRHPEIGMVSELPIKPRGPALLGSHAQEIRARIAGRTTIASSVSIAMHARLSWPGPTHLALFSILAPKSKIRTGPGPADSPREYIEPLRRSPLNSKIPGNESRGSSPYFLSLSSLCRRRPSADDPERPGGIRTRAKIALQSR